MERITVSPNKRFLATESGAPFFWLGDTAWELFHRLTRAEIETYLDNRCEKGFNVVQAVALAEFDGLRVPNMEVICPSSTSTQLSPTKPTSRSWISPSAWQLKRGSTSPCYLPGAIKYRQYGEVVQQC